MVTFTLVVLGKLLGCNAHTISMLPLRTLVTAYHRLNYFGEKPARNYEKHSKPDLPVSDGA